MPQELQNIEGITLEGLGTDRQQVLKLLNKSWPVAADLLGLARDAGVMSPIAQAAWAAMQTVTALMASAGPRCNLAAPPTDIEPKVDGNGNLIRRCQHVPPHEWDWMGKRLP